MRLGILAVGIVLVIVSVVFLEVPLFSQPNCSGTVGNNRSGISNAGSPPIYCKVTTLLLPLNVAVAWTSSGPGTLYLEICTTMTTTNVSGSSQDTLSGCSNSTTQSVSGSSGGSRSTPTISVANGDYLVIGFASQIGNGGASVTTKTSIPQVGLPILTVGAIVVIAGLVMRKRFVSQGMTPGSPPKKPVEGL